MKRLFKRMKRGLRSFQSAINRRGDLSTIVSLADPKAALADQVRWLETLLEWVRSSSRLPHDFDEATGQLQGVRLKFLLQFLDRNPEWKKNVSQVLRSILEQTSGIDLFARTELTQGSLLLEILERLQKKLLPTPPRERFLDDLFVRLFKSEADALWVENLPPDVIEGLSKLIQGSGSRDAFAALREAMLDAVIVLGENAAARGLSQEFRNRLPLPKVQHSPFLLLRRQLESTIDCLRDDPKTTFNRCSQSIESCREAIEQIIQHLDEAGVSVDLVYNLEVQKAGLRRIEVLLALVTPSRRDDSAANVRLFVGELIRESLHARQLRLLLMNNFRLLSQKIVERAGASGEHYITRTKEEYRQMFVAGLGGGFFTVFTTLAKFLILKSHLALFFEGLFAALNYGISFSIITLCHFTLATKQPAMTGPALAGKLRQLRGPRDIKAFVNEVTRLTRSQFAAAFGNIGAALPYAIVFDMGWYLLSGSHLLTSSKAASEMQKLNPLESGTLLFASWTGVTLWFSGIAAGWMENWVVYHRLPEAIGHHRILVSTLGARRAERVGHWFLKHSGSIFSCFALGALLGFTPVFGAFFGIPLDVRHVTLSAASLGFAISGAYGPAFDYWALGGAVVGLLCILLLNLGVSLSLAFIVACRAREVRTRSILILVRATMAELRKRPFSFLFHTRGVRAQEA